MVWLEHQRHESQLRQWLMGEKFDLDGALSSGQPELAWRAGQQILLLAVELHLWSRGVHFEDVVGDDRANRAGALLDALHGVNNQLAAETWDLLLSPGVGTDAEVAYRIERVLDFSADRLGVQGVSRGSTIQGWADSVDLLRQVARGLGLADSDDWYIHTRTREGAPIGWYEQVMSVVEEHR